MECTGGGHAGNYSWARRPLIAALPQPGGSSHCGFRWQVRGRGALAPEGNAWSEGNLPSKPNRGITIEGGAPSLRRETPGARATCPRNRTGDHNRGRGALAPRDNARSEGNLPSKANRGITIEGGAPSLQGKRTERGQPALETEPGDHNRGRGALAPREAHGARATCPRNRTGGSQSRAGRPRSKGSARSEGNLPSKPNRGITIEGGAPSLRA